MQVDLAVVWGFGEINIHIPHQADFEFLSVFYIGGGSVEFVDEVIDCACRWPVYVVYQQSLHVWRDDDDPLCYYVRVRDVEFLEGGGISWQAGYISRGLLLSWYKSNCYS